MRCIYEHFARIYQLILITLEQDTFKYLLKKICIFEPASVILPKC